jgi:hypothetical protein
MSTGLCHASAASGVAQSVCTVKPYQGIDLEKTVDFFAAGEPHVALKYCTAAGKSLMALCTGARLMARGLITHVVIAAPTEVIRDSFELRDYALITDLSGSYLPPTIVVPGRGPGRMTTNQVVAALTRYLQEPSGPIACTTHDAVRALRDAPAIASCKGRLLILDEVHHVGARGLRALRDQWLANSGLVLSMTGSPQRDDGQEVIPVGVPSLTRTAPRQMAEGFAPKYLLNEIKVVEGTEGCTDKEALYRPLNPEKTAAQLVAHMHEEYSNGPIKAILRIRNAGPVNKQGGGGRAENHAMMGAAARALHQDGKRVFISSSTHVRGFDPATEEDLAPFNHEVFVAIRRKCAERGMPIPLEESFSELRAYERSVKDVRHSCVDVIIGIQDVLEGFDWPLCSHIYFLGVPRRLLPLVQGVGRTMRLRWDYRRSDLSMDDEARLLFAGYSPYWAHHSKVVFLTSTATARRDQAGLMFMVCAYLSTFQQWSLLDAMSPIFDKLGHVLPPRELARAKDAIESLTPSQETSTAVNALVIEAEMFFRKHVAVEKKLLPFDRIKIAMAYHKLSDASRDEIRRVLYFNTERTELVDVVARAVAEGGADVVAATRDAIQPFIERFEHQAQVPNPVEEEVRKMASILKFDADQIEAAGAMQEFFDSSEAANPIARRRALDSFIASGSSNLTPGRG